MVIDSLCLRRPSRCKGGGEGCAEIKTTLQHLVTDPLPSVQEASGCFVGTKVPACCYASMPATSLEDIAQSMNVLMEDFSGCRKVSDYKDPMAFKTCIWRKIKYDQPTKQEILDDFNSIARWQALEMKRPYCNPNLFRTEKTCLERDSTQDVKNRKFVASDKTLCSLECLHKFDLISC